MKSSLNPLYSTSTAVLAGAIIVGIAILMHGGIIKVGKPQSATVGSGTTTAPQPAAAPSAPSAEDVEGLRSNDHVRGERNARVLLIEYSDLECPFCKRFHPTAQQSLDAYGGQVAWAYRHFPLDQIHPKARKLAEAVECANEMAGNDGFWKMADAIFEQDTVPEISTLPALASQIGLNQNQFKTCLDSGKFASLVEDDYQSGIKAGVTGTPGNFLMDTKSGKIVPVTGAVPFESLKSSIDSLLGN